MKRNELTVRIFLETEEGRTVPIDGLTESEKDRVFSQMNKRLTSDISRYISEHPEEYEKI